MIEKLTTKQEKQLIQFRQRWLRIGLCCEPANKKLAEDNLISVYRQNLSLKKPYFWWVSSPWMGHLVVSFLGQNLGQNLRQNLSRNLGQNLWQKLRQKLRQKLEQKLRQKLGQNLEQNLEQNLDQNLGQNLRQNLRQNWQHPGRYGQEDSYWIAFYLFPEQFLGINYGKYSEQLQWWVNIAKSCHWIWVFKKICFISDRPCKIKKKGLRLHADGESAVEFRDGYAIWCLNGVNVAKEIAETPAEKLNPTLLIKETNAEIRREIIRKIGISRILQKLEARKLNDCREYRYRACTHT